MNTRKVMIENEGTPLIRRQHLIHSTNVGHVNNNEIDLEKIITLHKKLETTCYLVTDFLYLCELPGTRLL